MLQRIEREEMPKVVPVDWKEIPVFNAILKELANGLRILVSHALLKDGSRWVHVSMSRKDRYPSWTEMRDFIKSSPLLDKKKEVKMVIPPEGEYVNFHPFCFHWWQEL